MSRASFLLKIRELQDEKEVVELPKDLPDFPFPEDPVSRFQTELEKVSGIFLDARRPASFERAFQKILEQTGENQICWESRSVVEKAALPYKAGSEFDPEGLLFSIHDGSSFRLPLTLNSRDRSKSAISLVGISVSLATLAIAETGSVFESLSPGGSRVLPILPPVHVALLSEKNLLANQSEFFQTVRLGEQGSAQILMTGPSRTADIEKTLILGVHGPKRLYVVLIA